MAKYKHTLIIGGTGMLAKATRYLINESDQVTILGRSRLRLNTFINFSHVNLLHGDYSKADQFLSQIQKQIDKHGVPDLFLCWMHSSGRNVFKQIIELLDVQPQTKVFHVLGSTSYDPNNQSKEWYQPNSHTVYRKVILGFKIDQGLSRWLFQEEISDGTIEAINSDSEEFIIGLIEPWDMHP